jgi:hypothetical protein
MRNLPLPRSPLSVVYGTIVLLMAISGLILLILICEWISPFWSRTAILLQGIALLVVGMAYRWRPSWRLVLYPVLLTYMIYLWDTTLPPPSLPEGMVRFLLPCVLLIGIAGDLMVAWWRSPPFAPKRIRVYGRYVNLDEAAHFFRTHPDIVRALLTQAGRPVLTGRSGEEFVALNDLLAVLEPYNATSAQRDHHS